MDYKREFKKILMEMSNGDLQKIIGFMNSGNYPNQVYVNVMITLSEMIINPKIGPKLSTCDVKVVIQTCSRKINNPTQNETTNYLRALYHSLKDFVQRLSSDDLNDLAECVLPEWISSKPPTEPTSDIIACFTPLIHNNFIIPNSKINHSHSIVSIMLLNLRLQKYVFLKDPQKLFAKILIYCSILHEHSKTEYFYEFCSEINKLLVDIDKLSDEETVKDAFHAFLFMIYAYFCKSTKNFALNRKNIENTFDILERYSIFDTEKLCTEIFKSFYSLTVRNLNEYTKNDIVCYKKLRKNFEQLKIHGNNISISRTLNYISHILRTVLYDIEKYEKDLWKKYVSPEIEIEYLKISQITGRLFSKTEYIDKCSKNCLTKYNFSSAITITSISGTFLNLSLYRDSENVEEIQEIALICLKDCCKYIECLKTGKCEKWTSKWSSIAIGIYNIAIRFYRSNNFKSSKIFFHFLCKYVIIFEGLGNTNTFIDNSLGVSLNYIGTCYYNMKQYRNALTYLSFAILVCPDLYDNSWSLWCNAKARASNDNLGNIAELTINQILEKDTDIIKALHPTYKYHSEKMETLLFLELQNYLKIWASKIPMNNACKELFKISNDPVTRTLAFNLTWDRVISLQDQDYIENLQKTITLLNKKDKRNTLTNQLCLSVLYYIDYQLKTHEVLKKNLSEMNETVREEKPVLKPYEVPMNPNDKCDIVPTYFNNKIENTMLLNKILNKSVELWNKILENKQLDTITNLFEELNIDYLIKLTAFEYRLQNFSFQMLKIWFLYLQYGQLFNKSEIIVTATGFILEVIDCKSEKAKHMEESAEKYLNVFIKDNVSLETITTYYINKSTGYLHSNLLEEGYRELDNAMKYLNLLKSDDSEEKQILEARCLFLKSLYLQKSCNIKQITHDENYVVLAHKAYTIIADSYKTERRKSEYVLSILFDISLSMGWMYKWLRMPREIRAYTSEPVVLAQQRVLPIRTVQFFSMLAFTDLLNCQFDDCKVKLSGIDYMMCYRNISIFTKSVTKDEKIAEINQDFEKLSLKCESSFETMLDIPVDHRMKNLQGSPILASKPFKIPIFIYHVNCNCFYCLNVDYQILVLECTHLEALSYLQQCNMQSSSDFFRGGVNLYKGILRKYDSLSKNISEELMEQFKKKLDFTYSNFLMDYSFYYCKKREYTEGEKIVDNIFEILGNEINTNAHFYSQILLQKTNLLMTKEIIQIKPVIKPETDELTVDFDIFLSKTPENKISVSKFFLSATPSPQPTPNIIKTKKISFDIFSSDEDNIPEIPVVKNKIFKFKTPAKTPAPNSSKIKIYTPASKNKIQPMCLPVSPNLPKKIEIPKSPVDPESKLRTKKILEKSTKLLTEKLKAEHKNVLKESNIIKNDTKKAPVKNQKENVQKSKLRKNLMDELSDSEIKDEVIEDIKTAKTKNQVKTQGNKISTKVPVKNKVKKQYKRILEHSSSSEESLRRSTRSVSKT